jgi:hypothetical protein
VDYGFSYPEYMNNMEKPPDMYIGYIPPLALESTMGHYVGIIDNGALDAMAIVAPDHATKGAEKEAQVKQKKKLDEAKKMRALKEQLQEHERTDRPRRRVTSMALLESMQNEVTIRGGESKAKPKKAKANKAKKPKASSSGDANKDLQGKKRAKR